MKKILNTGNLGKDPEINADETGNQFVPWNIRDKFQKWRLKEQEKFKNRTLSEWKKISFCLGFLVGAFTLFWLSAAISIIPIIVNIIKH